MKKATVEMDFYRKSDIGSAINEIEGILNTGIFTNGNPSNPFFKPSFVQVMILLRENRTHKIILDYYLMRLCLGVKNDFS